MQAKSVSDKEPELHQVTSFPQGFFLHISVTGIHWSTWIKNREIRVFA